MHTSTVTVAVLPEPTATELVLHDKDLEEQTCRGSGAGGQHRNKTESAVIITHKPTGVTVRCESERSQHQNRETALALLRTRILEAKQSGATAARAGDRKAQVGSGMRGDKIRTIRCQDGVVTDHVLGKQWNYKNYARGEW